MEMFNSLVNMADLLGTTPDNILAVTALAYAHWLFIEIVVQVLVVIVILKGIEWLAPRLMLFWAKRKSRRKQ